jgi:hypothetical protein
MRKALLFKGSLGVKFFVGFAWRAFPGLSSRLGLDRRGLA